MPRKRDGEKKKRVITAAPSAKQLEARARMKRAAKEYHAGKYPNMREAMKNVK